MKTIILALLLISSSSFADITLVDSTSNDPLYQEEYSQQKKEVIPLPEFVPQREISSTSELPDEEGGWSLQINSALLDGEMYLGKVDSHIQMESISLEAIKRNKILLYQVGLDSIKNTKSIQLYSLTGGLGVFHYWGDFEGHLYGGLLISNYSEQSHMQNVSVSSLGVHATIGANYYMTDNFYLSLNYKYYHLMFVNGLKYWGNDSRTDVVFDLRGLGIGVGWRF